LRVQQTRVRTMPAQGSPPPRLKHTCAHHTCRGGGGSSRGTAARAMEEPVEELTQAIRNRRAVTACHDQVQSSPLSKVALDPGRTWASRRASRSSRAACCTTPIPVINYPQTRNVQGSCDSCASGSLQ
jgi:hypothetical protein